MDSNDVRIGEVLTEMVVTEGVASLSPEDVKRLTEIAMQQVRQEQDRKAQQQRDTSVYDSNYQAHT
jgi:hypothetical protein